MRGTLALEVVTGDEVSEDFPRLVLSLATGDWGTIT